MEGLSFIGKLRGNQGKWLLNGAFYKADEYGYEAAAEYLLNDAPFLEYHSGI